MTSPGDGNDEVIRVVYQAVADYSQLLREVRRAKTETAALKRDIESLSGTTTARVKVTADTAQAQTELARVLRDVVVRVKVTVDAAAANAELQRLLREVTVKAKVTVDAAAASAELARLLRDTTVKAKVTFDAAAARVELGRLLRDTVVRVKLAVDATAARAEIARATRDTTIRVRVLPDVSRIHNLAALFADKVVRFGVDLDEAGITARFRALLAHLESLGPVDIEVDVHASAIDRLEAAAERLRRIRDDVQGGGGGPGATPDGAPLPPTPTPTPTPRPAPTPGRRGSSDVVPSGLATAAGMVLRYSAAAAAAVPVIAAASLAAGTMAASFLAAGAATGIFAVAAVGAMSRVTDAVKKYETTGQLAEGPIGAIVAQFEQLKARYKDFQTATDAPVLRVFSRGLQIAADLLDKVTGLVGHAADAVDGAMAQIQDAVNGPGLDDFLTFVDQQGPAAIAGFTRGLLGFAGGLGRLIEQFRPFIAGFVTGFADAGQAFDRWASGLGSNRQFQAFLDYAEANLPKVVDLIGNLVAAAANIGAALAPAGTVLLDVANAIAHWLATLDPGTLRAIIGAVVGLAVAIKAIQAAAAIGDAMQKFGSFISALPGRLGAAARAAGATSVAMKALGASLLIGAAVSIVIALLDKLGSAQRDAAAAAKEHQDAIHSFADELQQSGGQVTPQIRQAHLQTLQNTAIKGQYGNIPGTDWFGKTVETNVADIAEQAGLSRADVVAGNVGDAQAYGRVYGGLGAYAAKERARAEQPGLSAEDAQLALANADAADKAAEAYAKLSPNIKDVAADAAANAAATGESTAEIDGQTKSLLEQAGATGTVASALKIMAGTVSEQETAYNAAGQALDAYTAGQKALIDARHAQAAAAVAATRATQDEATALAAAEQRIRDVQRALRDMTLDQRQARLNVKESDLNLQKVIQNGGTADEIEQARIDNERAHNALNDLNQDKGPKKSALDTELAAGVAGNRAYQDAIQGNKDAAAALKTANTTVGTATRQLTDLQYGFINAAAALGMTTEQFKTFRDNMNKTRGKTVKLILDTTDAEKKMAALLKGEFVAQLMLQHMGDPKYTPADAERDAAKYMPAATPAKATPGTANPASGSMPIPRDALIRKGRAEGGPVYGPGTGTSDSVRAVLPVGGPVRLSNGEHIVTDGEVKAAPGGHGYLEAFRAGLRAGRPWGPPPAQGPPVQRGYAAGGPAPRPAAGLPVWRVPQPVLAAVSPGYAAGGPVAAMRAAGALVDRSVTVNVGTINNPVPEPAGTSLYRQVRRAVEGEER